MQSTRQNRKAQTSLTRRFLVLGLAALCIGFSSKSLAENESLRVAVAANFAQPAAEIAAAFESQTGTPVRLSTGATGKFYAQIRYGAPFDVLLAADSLTISLLIEQGLAVSDGHLTYATGQIALWSPDPTLFKDQAEAIELLNTADFSRLAMANPQVAPYGQAAQSVLTHLGLGQSWLNKRVQGQSIGQTFQFVSSRNADVGFVALSQIIGQSKQTDLPNRHPSNKLVGSTWLPPQSWYLPLKQDAAQLTAAQNPTQAQSFLSFLSSTEARAIIERYGYQL
ncbi:MAG: molybdate ABC transporter substrate-binding protein [Orrella sp.]